MRSIEVNRHISQLQALDGKSYPFDIRILRLLAPRDIPIRHQVCQRVGLDDDGKVQARAVLHEVDDRVDEFLVLVHAVVADVELTGSGTGGTVAVGEVVDYEWYDEFLVLFLLYFFGFFDSIREILNLVKKRVVSWEGELEGQIFWQKAGLTSLVDEIQIKVLVFCTVFVLSASD